MTDYAGELSRLQEQRRRGAVDMDMNAVNAADNAMKVLRAQTGRQTFGDRVGDVVGAAAAGTLGRLALSSVSEGAEEFAEGLFRPALQMMTYDPDAVWDDEWLNDTLYDTAVGAAVGGLGGGVNTAGTDTGQQKNTPAESQIYNWGIKTDASLDGAGRGHSRIPHGVSSDTSRK